MYCTDVYKLNMNKHVGRTENNPCSMQTLQYNLQYRNASYHTNVN